MHEFSVAHGVVDRAIETAADHGADRVDELVIEVGRATHLNPQQLRFCIEAVAKDTPAGDAAVRIETVDPRARCACGWEGEPAAIDDVGAFVPDPTCPDCGNRIDLTRGRECRLASIDVPAVHRSD